MIRRIILVAIGVALGAFLAGAGDKAHGDTPPVVVVQDCFTPAGRPCTTTTTTYVPTAADLNDVPAEPVYVAPAFTG